MPEQQNTIVLGADIDPAITDWNERAQVCKKNHFGKIATVSSESPSQNSRNQSLSAVAGQAHASRIFQSSRKESDYADGALQSMQLTRQWHSGEDDLQDLFED